MQSVPRELLWAIVGALLIAVFGLSHALLTYAPYAPAINSEQQADSGLQGNDGGGSQPKTERAEDEGTEFWPPFVGYRLKVTDTLVAAFTALLFFATVALWLATRSLVKGADDASRRQLRAYLSMNPKVFSNFVTGGLVHIEFLQRNHGQTPAFNITHIFDIAIFPNPLPHGFVFPTPTRRVDTNHTIFPVDDAKGWFYGGVPLTAADVAAVAANTHKIHIWGVTTYLDAFKNVRTTRFSAGASGQNFVQAQLLAQSGNLNGPPWSWEFESEHNQGT